jgi:hypothetical protein
MSKGEYAGRQIFLITTIIIINPNVIQCQVKRI